MLTAVKRNRFRDGQFDVITFANAFHSNLLDPDEFEFTIRCKKFMEYQLDWAYARVNNTGFPKLDYSIDDQLVPAEVMHLEHFADMMRERIIHILTRLAEVTPARMLLFEQKSIATMLVLAADFRHSVLKKWHL